MLAEVRYDEKKEKERQIEIDRVRGCESERDIGDKLLTREAESTQNDFIFSQDK